MERLELLLGYVSAHPSGRKIHKGSDMILRVLSDASYLSRPDDGSVAGSYHFLGSSLDVSWINHPISAHSTKIPVVCSTVAKSEYAGVFAAARIATDDRAILQNFGHPQPPTPLYCDNECAVGIVNSSVTQKMSKSLDMHLHWVRDRVQQGQFIVLHLPGLQNIADFFTKTLPVARHKDLAPFLALNDDRTTDDIVHAKLRLSALLFAACILKPAPSGCVDTSVAYVYR
jgi:hypothetical protein